MYMGIREKLPLLNSERRITRIAGYGLYAFLLFFAVILILPTPEVDDSTSTTAKIDSPTTTIAEDDSDTNWRNVEPTNAADWVTKGVTYEWNDDDTVNALRCYNKALELDPNNKDALVALEAHYFANEDYSNALKYNTESLKIDPEDLESLSHRAIFLGKLGRTNDAIATYDQIIELVPDDGSTVSKMYLADAWFQKYSLYVDLIHEDPYNEDYAAKRDYSLDMYRKIVD